MQKIKKVYEVFLLSTLLLFSCQSTSPIKEDSDSRINQEPITELSSDSTPQTEPEPVIKKEDVLPKIEKNLPSTITLLFAGDIMAHEENYRIDDFNKIN